MRFLFPMMSQGINHSETFNKVEHAFLCYGQLIIYFLAIVILEVGYLGAQQVIANYLESIQAIQGPQF